MFFLQWLFHAKVVDRDLCETFSRDVFNLETVDPPVWVFAKTSMLSVSLLSTFFTSRFGYLLCTALSAAKVEEIR